MGFLICPKCSKDFVTRAPRRGWIERLLSVFYVYPFRCQICGYRFRFLQWGVKYLRVPEDRRDYERLATSFATTFFGDNIKGAGTVLDISMTGCTFAANTPLAQGSIVRMALEIPAQPRSVNVDAAVVRNVRQDNVGVEFLRFQQTEKERLQIFIHGLLQDRRA